MKRKSLTYKNSGVDIEKLDRSMPLLSQWIERSFDVRPGSVKLPLGYFANVVDVGNGRGLALSTDGVGTKILIAQMLNHYNTIGIDCVAMNVNDVLCVGAEPIALLDYIAVQLPQPDLLGAIGEGLYRGAELAGVTIPGGEIAQVGEMIRGVRPDYGFDLVATCAGSIALDKILTGESIRQGDVIVGMQSSGLHSNGFTLVRRILADQPGWPLDRYVPELGRSLAEELLEPTRIYVKEVLAMMKSGLRIKALAHITGDGFLNLSRWRAPVGFVLDALPEPHPIFQMIQTEGSVSPEEMYSTFNMGIGFCVAVDPGDAEAVCRIAQQGSIDSRVIGSAVADSERTVRIPSHQLIGRAGRFQQHR